VLKFALVMSAVLVINACQTSTPASIPTPTTPAEPTANVPATVEAAVRGTATAGAAVGSTATAIAAAAAASPTVVPQPSATTLSLEDAVAQIKRYTVFIRADYPSGDRGAGSGISLGGGRALTNGHVVEDAGQVTVRFADGRQEPVRVVSLDRRRDLALLQSSFTDEPPAPIADARALRPAESLVAVGYPRSFELGAQDATITRGIYSARWQSPSGVWHVQTDTPMNPGNSGGPVADVQGRLVGVATWGVRGSVGLNFAVASDEVAAFLEGGGSAPPPASAPAASGVRPELSGHGASQRIVAPGGSVSLSYEVTNSGGAPVDAVLGASIRPAGGGQWIDDPANDRPVNVSPGKATYTRTFQVPGGTATGSYDVAWGLFSPDKQKSYGLEVEPGILSVGGAAAPAPAPSQPTAPSGAGPADAVRQHYSAINARDFATAWNLLSPRFQSTQSYNTWVNGFSTTRSVQLTSVSTVSELPGSATVAVTIVSTDASGAGTVTRTFQGTWTVVQIGGAWKLDAASIRQVG
jgi:putative serine protease PepD